MTQHLLETEQPSRRQRARLSAAGAAVGSPVHVEASAVAPGIAVPARVPWLVALLRNYAPQDWLITTYFTLMFLAVLRGTGPAHDESLRMVAIDWVVLAAGLALTRGHILPRGQWSSLVYRFTVFGTVVSSYFQLRLVLPAVNTNALDASIYAFDLRVFGVEPSVAWDRFVTPQTTEWFAFFYFGYFFILAAHVLPFLLAVKNHELLSRFALGIFTVFCVGHLTYMLVPGFGPYRFLAGAFHHEVTGGLFWSLVKEAVVTAGAQKDIFPSLHTAVPTFFALFSFRYRKELTAFRYTWPIVAFCASQIIIATLFLRWHYLVDIFAGLALASAAVLIAGKVVPREEQRRRELGLDPVWTAVDWGKMVRRVRGA